MAVPRNWSFTTPPASTSRRLGATRALLTITHTDALALAHVILVNDAQPRLTVSTRLSAARDAGQRRDPPKLA